jgi:hypothetical protein
MVGSNCSAAVTASSAVLKANAEVILTSERYTTRAGGERHRLGTRRTARRALRAQDGQ